MIGNPGTVGTVRLPCSGSAGVGSLPILGHERKGPALKICSRRALAFAAWASLPLLFGLSVATAGESSAGTPSLSYEYDFATPEIAAKADQVRVFVRSCDRRGAPGEPVLPFKVAKLLLPPGGDVTRVDVTPVGKVADLPLAQRVEHGQRPIPVGQAAGPAAQPNPQTYSAAKAVPGRWGERFSVQTFRGYRILLVRLYPVQYTPVPGKLQCASRLAVSVELGKSAVKNAATFRGKASDRTLVTGIVDNPELASAYASSPVRPASGSSYDYLLITSAALQGAFQPLLDQKTARGLAVVTETIEDIYSNYPGVDNAEKVRSFIQHAYNDWGVDYVLLGGDVAVVPWRGAYGYCDGVNAPTAGGYTDNTIPCDLYFACLDGPWNGDGDGIWGKPNDGAGGGDVDLLPEVYLGRAPVQTVAEVQNFVQKTVNYETNGHANPQAALFLGEYLGLYNGVYAQGGDALDILLDEFADYSITWLDDRPTHGATWSASTCISRLNASPHFVAHVGHANTTYCLRMGNSQVASLTNTSPFLVNSIGCICGAFDASDCFAEELIKRASPSGAFAVLMNSRYGWFTEQYEWMYSGEFMQAFFNRLLRRGNPRVGEALALSKMDMVARVETSGSMCYRWCYFEINLLGDPETPAHGAPVGYQLPLNAGWNLVSIPVAPLDAATYAVFPPAVCAAVWEYDNVSSYTVPAAVQSKKGYWVKANQPTTLTIIGVRTTDTSVSLVAGWNLVGVVGPSAAEAWQSVPASSVCQRIWEYAPLYRIPARCDEGRGFWIKATDATTIWTGN